MSDVPDYAQRILAKLIRAHDSSDNEFSDFFELQYGDRLVVDAVVALDEDEAGWLEEFTNRVEAARDR